QEIITYKRRKKGRPDNCVTDQGLRFTDDVPVEVIEENVPQLQGEEAEQYEIIDYKVTRRLAQRPGSYVVLEHRRPVLRHKSTQTLTSTPAPAGIFDRSFADVSLLAGMLIDKFVHHLPLHRQHHRMIMSGITISRSTLTLLVKNTIELLRAVYNALLESILASRVVAIDETPIKAGHKEKGKMQNAWFWPIYGLEDEIVFTFSTSKSAKHLEPLLENWQGVLLS
ncbi:transposase, partial [Sansalvadorimonas sp. 2012CJ34-2]